ncbi:MAG: TonB-dependent receptor [Bacteroidales bacterium]|nr:TonB-dependent receptor [Bacteroidales bacterium]
MKRIIILAAIALPAAVQAQNFNPTVEVTNTYEGRLLDIQKPMQVMPVPDSVTKFDMTFDYSVFEKPYSGSYDFQPYLINMKPQTMREGAKTFYFLAGAGYVLRPVVHAVFSPDMSRDDIHVNIYAKHDSYFGDYADISTISSWFPAGSKFSGYDAYTKAGVDGEYSFGRSALGWDVHYTGVHSKDWIETYGFNSISSSLGLRSVKRGVIDYAARFGFTHSSDRGVSDVRENILSFSGSFGPEFSRTSKILVDADLTYYSQQCATLTHGLGVISIIPHFVFTNNRWTFDLGARITSHFAESELNYVRKPQLAYPDAKIRYTLVDNKVTLYANVGGGERINTITSLKEGDRFIGISMLPGEELNSSIERIRLDAGIRGNISERFGYDAFAGYSITSDKLLYSMKDRKEGDVIYVKSTPSYGLYNDVVMFAGLRAGWHSRTVDVNGEVVFQRSDIRKSPEDMAAFLPPALTASLTASYVWNERLGLTVGAAFASERKLDDPMSLDRLPSWLDLQAKVEYRLTHKLSLWASGTNLLSQPVYRTPLHTVTAPSVTGGFCLNF